MRTWDRFCMVLALLLLTVAAVLGGGCSALGGDAPEARNSPGVTVNVSPVATNAWGPGQGAGSVTEAWGDSAEGSRTPTGGGSTATPTTTTNVNPADSTDAPAGK